MASYSIIHDGLEEMKFSKFGSDDGFYNIILGKKEMVYV